MSNNKSMGLYKLYVSFTLAHLKRTISRDVDLLLAWWVSWWLVSVKIHTCMHRECVWGGVPSEAEKLYALFETGIVEFGEYFHTET